MSIERDGGFYEWEKRKYCRHQSPAMDEDVCKTPIEECNAKNGPASCRFHGSQQYYTKLFETTPYEQSLTVLRQHGIEPIRFEDFVGSGYFENVCSRQLVEIFKSGATSVSKEEFKDTCRAVSVVVSDIKKRFLKEINIDYLVPTSLQRVNVGDGLIGGATDLDHIWSEKATLAYCFYPNIKYSGYCYGHNDERFPYDIIRHEIGHILTTKEVFNTFQSIKDDRRKGMSELEFSKLLLKSTSQMAIETHDTELIAELFARITSPDYEKGTIPSDLEDLVFFNMLDIEGWSYEA